MRKLGQHLGADPMSAYHHVGGREGLLAAMADHVVAGIPLAPSDDQWQGRLRTTIYSARQAMLRHPWAPRVIIDLPEPTPAILAYLDAVLGVLRNSGFSLALTHHALHVLGSRVLGFGQDLFDDSADARPEDVAGAASSAALAKALPHVAELAVAVRHDGGLGGCDDDEEFAFTLELLLEGLENRRATTAARPEQ
jgi:AcrR family transcriptional regulator